MRGLFASNAGAGSVEPPPDGYKRDYRGGPAVGSARRSLCGTAGRSAAVDHARWVPCARWRRPILEGRGSGGLVCKRRPCVRRLPIHVLRVGLADRWWPARGLTFVRPWRPVQDIAYGWPKGRIAAHVGFDGRLVSRLRPIRSRLPDVVLMGESIRPTDAHACSLGTIAGWIGRILQRLAARLVERVRVISHSWIGLPSGEASVGALTHVTERQPDRGQCRARAFVSGRRPSAARPCSSLHNANTAAHDR